MTRMNPQTSLTKEDINEFTALFDAIQHDPRQVHPSKMERFTELMVAKLKQGQPHM